MRRSGSRWAIASACALVVLISSFAFTPESLPHLPLCPMMSIFELPCPGCGMTRAFTAIAHARFADAWSFNPFSFFLFAAAIAIAAAPVLARRLQLPKISAPHLVRASIAFVSVMWIWDLFRIFA